MLNYYHSFVKTRFLGFLLAMFIVSVSASYAQSITVKGTVVSEGDNQPVPGALVSVKGTQKGTVLILMADSVSKPL